VIPAILLTDDREIETRVTLYRPETKQGDSRIWISRLREFASANDLLLLFAHEQRLHVINLTTSDICKVVEQRTGNYTTRYLDRVGFKESGVFQELIDKLRRLALGDPLPQVGHGDTAIGRTIEAALGIDMNPDKTPDYKGIELKSRRAFKPNRSNLFAQVPDWSISVVKSSRELLDKFGYARGELRKLYVTVRAGKPNPQGLYLELDTKADLLHEASTRVITGNVVTWRMEKLRARLLEKHRETLWIEAVSTLRDGKEHFKLTKAVHTKAPILGQLEPLILAGTITLDHLISSKKGTDKGPLFKIEKEMVNSLFGTSTPHALS